MYLVTYNSWRWDWLLPQEAVCTQREHLWFLLKHCCRSLISVHLPAFALTDDGAKDNRKHKKTEGLHHVEHFSVCHVNASVRERIQGTTWRAVFHTSLVCPKLYKLLRLWHPRLYISIMRTTRGPSSTSSFCFFFWIWWHRKGRYQGTAFLEAGPLQDGHCWWKGQCTCKCYCQVQPTLNRNVKWQLVFYYLHQGGFVIAGDYLLAKELEKLWF